MSHSSKLRKARTIELITSQIPVGGRILEVSCGQGHELRELQARGYEARGTNYTQYPDELPGIDIAHGVDLLAGLPFADGTFDGVILQDVIEHVRDHDRALAELARVCKDGGQVLVMTPNTMKLSSRLHFLLTGFFKIKRAFIGFDVASEDAFAFHNYPPHLPVFLYQMRSHGLAMSAFAVSGYKAKSLVFWLLLFPFVWLATGLKIRGEKHLAGTREGAELRRLLTSFGCLCGEFWFVLSRKGPVVSAGTTKLPDWARKWQEPS